MNFSKDILPLLKVVCLVVLLSMNVCCTEIWERPGCHLVGHTQKIAVHGCISFWARTNACRGYCESYSVPSTKSQLERHPEQLYTSRSTCCNIVETHNVTYNVRCIGGYRTFTFHSAAKCECFYCNKEEVVLYDQK